MYIETLEHTQKLGWSYSEGAFVVEDNRHYESLFALGTGYMTVRSSVDEGFADDDQSTEYMRMPMNVTLEKIPESKNRYGTFLPVVQTEHPLLKVGLANLPSFLPLVVTADGETLDMEYGKISDYHRWLDIREATLYRTFVWETESGAKLNLLFKRFMNPELRFTCVQECRITVLSGTAAITVTSSVDNNVRTNGCEAFSEYGVDADGSVLLSDVTTNIGKRVVTASDTRVSTCDSYSIDKQARIISAVFCFDLAAGEESTIQKESAVASDMYYEADELVEVAKREVASLIDQECDTLHQAHVAVWSGQWEMSDVVIEANDPDGYDSQLSMRMAIYHLLRAKGSEEYRSLVDPKGMTSEVYFGSVFWDMDIFIQPFYIYTNHVTAKTTPLYRYHNLGGAKKLAAAAGYHGARYPWMGAVDGSEVCPLFEYADHQVHVTTDAVIGTWHYIRESGDTEFLYECAAEMMVETSRYWVDRVDRLKGRDGYHILGVMGPDEYTHFCNNNAYTNHSVKFCLNLTVDVVNEMQQKAPDAYQALCDKVSLQPEEVTLFKEIAEGLSIPVDEKRHIVWQCDNYDTIYAELDIEGIWKDRKRAFGEYVPQEKRYRSKVMKQSDVGALLCLFSEDFTLEQKKASLAYYKPYNTNESSNSMCHNMILAANVGDTELAYDSWKASLDIDFGADARSSDGIHCANVGGMWQQVVHGFAGMVTVLHTDTLTFRPCMPAEIETVSFKLYWKGDLVRITVTQTELTVENLSDSDLDFVVNHDRATASAGASASIAYA